MRATFSSALIATAAVLALCSVGPAAASVRVEPEEILGGWSPIKDVSNPHIQELGGWAVSQHVKQANDGVRFGKVVSGEEQLVSGKNYELVIEATYGAGKSATYRATVYDEPWTKTRELLAFEPAN